MYHLISTFLCIFTAKLIQQNLFCECRAWKHRSGHCLLQLGKQSLHKTSSCDTQQKTAGYRNNTWQLTHLPAREINLKIVPQLEALMLANMLNYCSHTGVCVQERGQTKAKQRQHSALCCTTGHTWLKLPALKYQHRATGAPVEPVTHYVIAHLLLRAFQSSFDCLQPVSLRAAQHATGVIKSQ